MAPHMHRYQMYFQAALSRGKNFCRDPLFLGWNQEVWCKNTAGKNPGFNFSTKKQPNTVQSRFWTTLLSKIPSVRRVSLILLYQYPTRDLKQIPKYLVYNCICEKSVSRKFYVVFLLISRHGKFIPTLGGVTHLKLQIAIAVQKFFITSLFCEFKITHIIYKNISFIGIKIIFIKKCAIIQF